MSTTTSKYGITKPDDADPLVEVVGNQLRAAMDRIDLMMGEGASLNVTPSAADTTTAIRVNFSRTYPAPPTVVVCMGEPLAVSTTVNLSTNSIDTTGFTLNIRANTTTTRTVRWIARPS